MIRPPVIAALPNFRDLGGHRARDGRRFRSGVVYRSTDLARLEPGVVATLANLGIRTVIDLRTAAERVAGPDMLPPRARYFIADVLADAPGAGPTELMALLRDATLAARLLGGGRAGSIFVEKYREFVRLPSARAAYGRLFSLLADETRRPALFHCTTGKDRTGWAAVALLLLLGVPEEAIMTDYLASGPLLRPVFQPMIDAFEAQGGDPELLLPLVEVRVTYLDAALEEMRAAFGSVEAYFAQGLGIDTASQIALADALLGD